MLHKFRLQGGPIDVRAAKLIAGLEAECTNLFLIALAEVATDESLDFPEAANRCMRGEAPGSGPVPRKGKKVVYPNMNITCRSFNHF
jgi:hypothetical protein